MLGSKSELRNFAISRLFNRSKITWAGFNSLTILADEIRIKTGAAVVTVSFAC